MSNDWMPGTRAKRLEMAQNWSVILDDKGDAADFQSDGVPAGKVSALDTAMVAAPWPDEMLRISSWSFLRKQHTINVGQFA
jgi:hypothetical protein